MTRLVLLKCLSICLFWASCSLADDSWKQAYDAAFVRVKSSGFFQDIFEEAAPGLLTTLRTLADCPSLPNAFPFPTRYPGSQLDLILERGHVQFATQINVTEVDSFPNFQAAGFAAINKAMIELSREVVKQLSIGYDIDLEARFDTFPTADDAASAVAGGEADATDSFVRQYTFVDDQLKQVSTTPACTIWVATITVSWYEQSQQLYRW